MPPAKKTKKNVQASALSEESGNQHESSMALVRIEHSAAESEGNVQSDSRVMIKTPQKTPRKQRAGGAISQPQKNAMIENLRLEIAERSRRLRARYTTQAQYLRQQIEWRIDRVPIKLRNMTMGELLDQYASASAYHGSGRSQAISVVNDVRRLSSGTRTTNEKENAPLVVAKKRAGKTGPTPAAPVCSPQKRPHKAVSPLRQIPQQQVKVQTQTMRPLSPTKKSPPPPAKIKRPIAAKKEKMPPPPSPTKAATTSAPPPRRGRAGTTTTNHRLSTGTDASGAITSNSSVVYTSTASKRIVKNVKSNGRFKENHDDGPTINSTRTVSDKSVRGRVTKAPSASSKKTAVSTTASATGAGRKRVLRPKK